MQQWFKAWGASILLVISFLLCITLWYVDTVALVDFEYVVPQFTEIPSFETNWLYLYCHLFTLIPVLLLSFDRRVHFYTTWTRLVPAIFMVAFCFIVWDVIFTKLGVWGFNEKYYLPFQLFGLPLEEWLFFFTVPFACLFIYCCLNYYVKQDVLSPFDKVISLGVGGVLVIAGLLHLDKLYTATTFLFTGSFVLFHFWKYKNNYRTRFYLAYLVSWIPFLIVDGVLTGGFSQEPIVLYHPQEFLGIRIGSIPLEDSIYSLLMLMSITTLFEWARKPSVATKEMQPATHIHSNESAMIIK